MTNRKDIHPLRALISRIFCPSSSTCSEHAASRDLVEELLTANKDGSSETDTTTPDYTARVALVMEAAAPGKPCETLEEANATIALMRKQSALRLWHALAYSDFFAKDRARLDELTARTKTCSSSHELVQAFVSYLEAGIPLHRALAHAHDSEPRLFETIADEVVTPAPIMAASTPATQDNRDSWEFMQTVAQGVSAEREAFEAIADAPETASSEDDFWASLPPVEDDEPITDAEIADTLGALFDVAADLRAERLAAEAEAPVAEEEAQDVEAEPEAIPAAEAVETGMQGEAQPAITDGWQSRTVYGVEVLGAAQDKAWAAWLVGSELSGPELSRHLRDEGYEGRIATETASRMLQHSRAKATVGRAKNAKHYHLLDKAG